MRVTIFVGLFADPLPLVQHVNMPMGNHRSQRPKSLSLREAILINLKNLLGFITTEDGGYPFAGTKGLILGLLSIDYLRMEIRAEVKVATSRESLD